MNKISSMTIKNQLLGMCNYLYKQIPLNKRQVKISKELGEKLQKNYRWIKIIEEISSRSINCCSLNEYLTKYTSNNLKFDYNEKFLNATQLHHLHVNVFNKNKVKRSDYLLIIYYDKNYLYMIDILPHNPNDAWMKPIYLYNILLNNWKYILKYNKLNSNNISDIKITDKEAMIAIQNNINIVLPLNDGNNYSMLGRISTDGSSGKALTLSDKIEDMINNINKK